MKKSITSFAVVAYSLSVFSQAFPDRASDPFVLKGSDVATYTSTPADEIVGFKYAGGSWIQIPIQIDEMELKDIVAGYGPVAVGSQFPPSPGNPQILFYCDSTTNIGEDSNINFDADDELVFMLKDAGEQFTGTNPPNATIAGSGSQIQLTDPATGNTRYVYLFRQDGSLQQHADSSYLSFTSNVSSVTGWPAHLNGLNNENTTISSPKYTWHISAEWKSDELKIALGSNADILDRHKNFFADGYCGRSENTFSDAENAYLTSKTGPIRVIRSVMGANSGPLTQRTHLFYEGRFDIITNLRVHSIPSVFDVFDYSPAAAGMIYSNNINGTTTANIDGLGTADGLNTNGVLSWEQVKGTQGTLSQLHRKSTNINSVPTDNTTFLVYYNDNSSSPGSNCTGDNQAWGASGWGASFTGSPTTDPLGDAGAANLRYLQATRIAYVDAATVADTAALHYNTLFNLPVTASVSAFLDMPTSVRSNGEDVSVSLYPNPANNSTLLQVTLNDYSSLMYEVVDVSGKTIAFGSITNPQTLINTGTYPTGVYVVKVVQKELILKAVRLLKN